MPLYFLFGGGNPGHAATPCSPCSSSASASRGIVHAIRECRATAQDERANEGEATQCRWLVRGRGSKGGVRVGGWRGDGESEPRRHLPCAHTEFRRRARAAVRAGCEQTGSWRRLEFPPEPPKEGDTDCEACPCAWMLVVWNSGLYICRNYAIHTEEGRRSSRRQQELSRREYQWRKQELLRSLSQWPATRGVDDQQQVLEKYFKEDPDEEVVVGCPIPVNDFRKLQDPWLCSSECAKLASACLDWGFFQLVNHGLREEVTRNLMNDVVEFFKQPLEVKKECAQQPDSVQGYGQAFFESEDERMEWVDKLYLHVHPCGEELAYSLLEFMAKAVGAEPALLRGALSKAQGMRVNYYPPYPKATDRVMGVMPHTDTCGLTLLLQRYSDVHGLQSKGLFGIPPQVFTVKVWRSFWAPRRPWRAKASKISSPAAIKVPFLSKVHRSHSLHISPMAAQFLRRRARVVCFS
ncbi:hypothetical protein HU200_035074 [Digitaria exilis]|uniref:Fe2OG dioxygenase domain-containing protein n=1 Tax=Digitaria exilis TaxID=1010633 RepID=A0A835BUN3_9POAL|nr:hypothetical protein HU200_035074 [Digitaria exilis]